MATITATPLTTQPHLVVAEIETEEGYRYWSKPMPEFQLSLWIRKELRNSGGSGLSDVDCSTKCTAPHDWE